MNLIQQQNAAKDLPLQYLQQAVNGQNPNLTPWIATAELQRRTTMNQHMQNAQGPQPTVKDQVEQKAGLMATQAAQQAQAAQAQQNNPPPGPIPGEIPQPEPQPEEPVMAARGGLMNAPVSFNFAHGGILGFADGGETANTNIPETYVDDQGVRRFTATNQPVQAAQQMQAPAPQPRPQGLRAGVEQFANEPTQAASLPAAIADQRALQKAFGTDQPMGVEEREYFKRQDELQKRREAQAKDLAYAAYVQGTVGTPGSGALAYNQTLANALGQEGEYGQQRYKDLAALNTAQRAAAEKQQTEAGTAFGAAKTASAAERLGKAGIGERLLNIDTQAANAKMQDLTSRYNNDQTNKTHLRIAELTRIMQGAQFSRQEARDAANRLDDIYRNIIRDEQVAQKELQAAQARFADEKEIAPLKANLEAIRALKQPAMEALQKKSGLPAAAAAPATTMAPDRAAQFKVLR